MRYKNIHIQGFPIKHNVKNFCYEKLIRSKRKTLVYRFLFYFLNICVFSLALFIIIISTLRIGNLLNFLSDKNGISTYIYITTSISTVSSFLGSMISFFLIKDAYYKNSRIYSQIKSELIQFKLKVGRYCNLESGVDSDTLLFENVCKILNFSGRLRDDNTNDFIQVLSSKNSQSNSNGVGEIDD